MSSDQCYYVYAITVDGAVRYIGKGRGSRLQCHIRFAKNINRSRELGEKCRALKFHNRLAKALRAGAEIKAVVLIGNLSHEDALSREIWEIGDARRRGIALWNETSGGDGVDSKTAKKFWADPKFRAKLLALRRSEEFRQSARKKTLAQFADPAAREASSVRSKAHWATEEFRNKIIPAVRRLWDDVSFRERHKAAVIDGWRRHPERALRRAEITKSYATKPGARVKASKVFKRLWQEPEFRKKTMAHWLDPERKRAIVQSWTPDFLKRRGRAIAAGLAKSEAARQQFADPERRRKLIEGGKTYWQSADARSKQSAKMKALWDDPEYRAKTTAHWTAKRKSRDAKS